MSSVLDCRYEIKNRLNLLSCNPRKPLNELFNSGAVLKVLEECPDRHSRFAEDPSAADLGWVPFDCGEKGDSSAEPEPGGSAARRGERGRGMAPDIVFTRWPQQSVRGTLEAWIA